MMHEGRLVYVVGPSGAGKDSVIARARENINKNNNLYFSPRYVTRPVAIGSDDIAFSAEEFARYQRIGMFALDWEAHGLSYGVSLVINNRLREGKTVVVNGSRAYLPTAYARYPRLTVVLITVPPEVASARLLARGRESATAILDRLQRAPAMTVPPTQLITIDNSGALEHAARAFADVLIGNGNQGFDSARSRVTAL